jgi:hypothetical protein
MKFLPVLPLLLLSLPGWAQEATPPLPAPAPVPPPQSGLVPGVKLQSDNKVGRTWSDQSPFNIWGGNQIQRANLFTAAGLVRKAALEALRLPDQWTNPIIIQIREPLPANAKHRDPVWTVISQVEGGFRLEVNLSPHRNTVPGPLLKEGLVRAVLADGILRGNEKLNLQGAPTPPPDWLLHGTLALMEYRELGRMSQTFSRVFQLGRVLSVQEILNAEPKGMDSVSHTIYRVSCGALIMMLAEQADGPAHLARLLPQLARGGTDHADLIARSFPGLSGSANGLSKWWSLQIAALSQPGLDEVMRPDETEQLLSEALVLKYALPDPKEKKASPIKRLFGKDKNKKEPDAAAVAQPVSTALQSSPLQEYARVLALPEPAPVFNQVDLALTRLMLRAHPVYRPLITEYQEIARQLGKKKTARNLPETLQRLASTRERLALTLRKAEDHLDWYEATQSTQSSGSFDGYLKTADELSQPSPDRNDPISRYLDEVEAELGR